MGVLFIAFCVVIPSLYQSQAHRHLVSHQVRGGMVGGGAVLGMAAPYSLPLFFSFLHSTQGLARVGPPPPPPPPLITPHFGTCRSKLGMVVGEEGGKYKHLALTQAQHTHTLSPYAQSLFTLKVFFH
jgi:hypothetical protein